MKNLIEIFKAGVHTDMNGNTLTFTAQQLEDMVARYNDSAANENFEAPIVVGHPKHDNPAYGWIKRLEFADGTLKAIPHQVEESFKKLVNEGRYKKISVSLHAPDAENNPSKGAWMLKHVGFLGAVAPAVKGLKTANLSENDKSICFEQYASGDFQFSEDIQDKAIDNEQLKKSLVAKISEFAEALFGMADAAQKDISAQKNETNPNFNQSTKENEMALTAEDIKKKEEEFAAKEAAFAEKETAFAAKEAENHKVEVTAFAEELLKEGKITAAVKNSFVAFATTLKNTSDEVCFADSDGKDKKLSQFAAFKEFAEGLPTSVEFAEKAAEDEEDNSTPSTASFMVDATQEDKELVAKANKHAAENKVSFADAIQAVAK